jgi:hypothetical protein
LVEEEGLEKEARQQKLSDLFVRYDSSPVVVLEPNLLPIEDQKKYYNILEGPIKTHVKKASKQLKSTHLKLAEKHKKILIIVNNGYSALNMDEFKAVAEKCVKNDTTNIDYVICCGVYYYSDGFDSYVIAPFEITGIYDDIEPEEFTAIQNSWNVFLNQLMTKFVTEPKRHKHSKLPIIDFEFEVGEITFVKPAPPFGRKSDFWVAGRPRINSTGIEVCPTIGLAFPKLSTESWHLIMGVIDDHWMLKNSYQEWLSFSKKEESSYSSDLPLFIPVSLENEDLVKQIENDQIKCFSDLCKYAASVFDTAIREIILSARELSDTKTDLNKYILLVNREIGRDKKNDLCSIYIAQNTSESETLATLVENRRVFFEYGMALAAAYAIKENITMVLHYTDKTYAWD